MSFTSKISAQGVENPHCFGMTGVLSGHLSAGTGQVTPTIRALMAGNTDIHAQVLLVDDDRGHAETMADALKKPGHVCTIRHSRAEAEDELRHGAFDVIVTDLVMESPTAGLEVLELAKRLQPDAETIMVTAHGDIPTAKRALQGGAYDFIEKPIDLVVFRNLVQRAAETVVLRHQNSRLKGELDAAFGFEGIIGELAEAIILFRVF